MPKKSESQRAHVISEIRSSSEKISQINANNLCAGQKVGAFKFEKHIDIFSDAALLAKAVQTLDFEAIPHHVLIPILDSLNQIRKSLEEISEFQAGSLENPKEQHREIESRLIGNSAISEFATRIARAEVFERSNFEKGNAETRRVFKQLSATEQKISDIEKQSAQHQKNMATQLRAFQEERTNALREAKNQFDKLETSCEARLKSVIDEFSSNHGTPNEIREALNKFDNRVQSDFNDLEQRFEEANEIACEAKRILEDIQHLAGKEGVAAHARFFHAEAAKHKGQSVWWLIGSLALMLVTGFATYLLLIEFGTEINEEINTTTAIISAVRGITARLVIISIGYFGIVWAIKNYRIHKELEVTNSHRRNALTTFRIFIKHTDSPDMRNAILLEVTRCIFAPTSFNEEHNDPELPIEQLLNVMKKAK